MSESKQILKEQFVEHFLFDYTDKDEFEVQMLSEIFEGIYYQKDKHFKPESKYWQVFRCLKSQQAQIDDLQKRIDVVSKSIDSFFDNQVGTPTQREYCNFIAEIKQALRGEHE